MDSESKKGPEMDHVLMRWNSEFSTYEFLHNEFGEGSLHLDKARRFTFDSAADLVRFLNPNSERPWSTSSVPGAVELIRATL